MPKKWKKDKWGVEKFVRKPKNADKMTVINVNLAGMPPIDWLYIQFML